MNQLPAKKTKRIKIVWKGFLLRIFFVATICALSYFGFVFHKIYQAQQKTVVLARTENSQPPQKGILETAKSLLGGQRAPLRGQEQGRINILLLGMGGEGHKGKDLTDTIMLVSVDPVSLKSAMFSIPRDLYAEIGDSKIFTKINAIYAYGLKSEKTEGESLGSLKETIKKITGQEVHYYAAVDFEGFKKIIEEIGGIDVEVEHDIYDPLYPGPNFSYQTFQISKGFQHLDADTALKYARVRHTKGGDFGRAARQQQVIAAAKRKALSLGTILNPAKISALLETIGGHFKTDVQLAEIPSFIHLANNINIYQTTNKVLDAWSENALLASTHVELGGVPAYVLLPRAKNYSQIHELCENIFDLEASENKSSAIRLEEAKISISPGNKISSYKTKGSMKKMGYETEFLPLEERASICPQGDAIVSHSAETKVFTLDDLAKKLEMEIIYKHEQTTKNDITICFSDESLAYFENQTEDEPKKSTEFDQDIFDSQGNVLINKK